MSQAKAVVLDVQVAMDTDLGRKRKQNQDAIGHMIPTDPGMLGQMGQVFVLADGVGGLTGGDLASQYAVSTIISSYYKQDKGEPPERLARAIAEANQVIYAEGQGQDPPTTMATTVVAAVIRGRELIIGSVGDSPAFLMRDANARKLTLDHTLEAMRREAGLEVDEDSASNRKLVRALGSRPSVKVDIITGKVRAGDHVVLCSDGLTRYVSPQEIEMTVAIQSPVKAVDTLIEMANERGGGDNISVIVLRLTEDEGITQPAGVLAKDRIRRPRDDDTLIHQPPAPGTAPDDDQAGPGSLSDNPLADLWHILRSNATMTIAGVSVLLVVFLVVMVIVSNVGSDDDQGAMLPSATSISPADQQATVRYATAQAAQAATAQMQQQAQAAAETATVRALTPTSTPLPSGPILEDGMWFHITPGDPILAYLEPSETAEAAPALESIANLNFRVVTVDHDAPGGPWYQVNANTGAGGLRWVNGPSMHRRVEVVSDQGVPLPPEQQPPDIPPATAGPTATPTVTPVPTATPTLAATFAPPPTFTPPPIFSTPAPESGDETPDAPADDSSVPSAPDGP